jgi:hypothetical protein
MGLAVISGFIIFLALFLLVPTQSRSSSEPGSFNTGSLNDRKLQANPIHEVSAFAIDLIATDFMNSSSERCLHLLFEI